MPEHTALPPLPVRTDLPEPTEAEVEALADLLTAAELKGIRYGHWTLARVILGTGYRLMPEPEPVRYGICVVCGQTHPVVDGLVVEHPGRGLSSCTGAKLVPSRIVAAAEAVSTDG